MALFDYIGTKEDQRVKVALGAKEPGKTKLPQTISQQELAAIFTRDPRPDLIEDTHLWRELLRKAQLYDPKLAGTLHGFRCGGLRIKKGQKSYILRPDIDPQGKVTVWQSQGEYDRDKEVYLQEYKGEILELMAGLRSQELW